jgi:hypothetical protein
MIAADLSTKEIESILGLDILNKPPVGTMKFLDDPKWSIAERLLHVERWTLKLMLDKLYQDNPERYAQLAKRYHELNKIIDDEERC